MSKRQIGQYYYDYNVVFRGRLRKKDRPRRHRRHQKTDTARQRHRHLRVQ